MIVIIIIEIIIFIIIIVVVIIIIIIIIIVIFVVILFKCSLKCDEISVWVLFATCKSIGLILKQTFV